MQVQEYMKPFLAAPLLSQEQLEEITTKRGPAEQSRAVLGFLPIADRFAQALSLRYVPLEYDDIFQEAALALQEPARNAKNPGALCKGAMRAIKKDAIRKAVRSNRLIKIPLRMKMRDALPDAQTSSGKALLKVGTITEGPRRRQAELREALYDFLDLLPVDERSILIVWAGLDGDALTLEQIAGNMDIPKSRVWTIFQRGLQRMRDYGAMKALAPFWGAEEN